MKIIFTIIVSMFIMSHSCEDLYQVIRKIIFNIKVGKITYYDSNGSYSFDVFATPRSDEDETNAIEVAFTGSYLDDGPNARIEMCEGMTEGTMEFWYMDGDNKRTIELNQIGRFNFKLPNVQTDQMSRADYADLFENKEVRYSSIKNDWAIQLKVETAIVRLKQKTYNLRTDGSIMDSSDDQMTDSDTEEGSTASDVNTPESDCSYSWEEDQQHLQQQPIINDEQMQLYVGRLDDSHDSGDEGDDDESGDTQKTDTRKLKNKKTARKLVNNMISKMSDYFKKLSVSKI